MKIMPLLHKTNALSHQQPLTTEYTDCLGLRGFDSWLVGWLFNSTTTQKGHFVPTAGEGKWVRRLKMANEIQCILPYVTR